MTVPAVGTAPLDNPDHTAEHNRIATQLQNDLPRGVIAYTAPAGVTGAAVGNTPVALFTLTNVSLHAGRLYLLGFTVRALQHNVQQAFQFNLSPTTIKHCGAYVDTWKANVAGATHDCIYWEQTFTVDSDVTVVSIQLTVAATNGNVWTDGCFMLIRDIGPDRGKIP